MMPPRAVLNVGYVWFTQHMDEKQKQAFDDDLYGWSGENEAGDRALFGPDDGGGE